MAFQQISSADLVDGTVNTADIAAGAVTGDKLGLTSINANNIVNGGVTVAKGGTGLSTLTSNNVILGNGTAAVQFVAPGTTGNVLTSNGNNWISQAAGGGAGGGDYIMTAYTSPATWTKPAGLKAVKVTVIGAGGNGGAGTTLGCATLGTGGNGGGGGAAVEYLDAPAIPGPVTVTVGTAPSKTSSFGPFCSATGGTNGDNASPTNSAPVGPYAGGTGSGGTFNIPGTAGYGAAALGSSVFAGGSALGFGASILGRGPAPAPPGPVAGLAGFDYGGGGIGSRGPAPAGLGGAGIVIVEEFY